MLKKCPSCGGELEKKREKLICPYCNSTYDVEKSDKKSSTELLDPDLFFVDVDLNRLMEKKCTSEVMRAWKYCMDENETSKDVEEYLRKITQKDDGTAMKDVRGERIENLRGRMDPELESGERVIMLIDTTLFGKGKDFYVITDRAVRFFKKKKSMTVKFDDIIAIKINDSLNLPSFYLNESYETSISSVANSYQTLGAMLALITRLAFEYNEDRSRIRII
ncbi:MAG: hypothetical protein K6G76_11540 [Lachnospiraceae bacterium]|nr:hypothetical protein [Lachnospiraceae bacterium]